MKWVLRARRYDELGENDIEGSAHPTRGVLTFHCSCSLKKAIQTIKWVMVHRSFQKKFNRKVT
ncbi:hypothetical protein JCM19039_2936 [Geomicrobium sp. JCM 19039]|nr:hypothetical protein JCM19039_2936 [Geomicrobium sp. JCM 19039]